MAGLDPAIHVFAYSKQIVDARHKAGHDEALLEAAPNACSGQLAALLLEQCRIRGSWLRWGMAFATPKFLNTETEMMARASRRSR
jgi:hypothetical protein